MVSIAVLLCTRDGPAIVCNPYPYGYGTSESSVGLCSLLLAHVYSSHARPAPHPKNARFLTEPLLRGARHLRRSVQVSTALRGTCRVRRCGLHTPPHAGRPIAGPRLGSPHRGPASRPL